MLLIWTSGLASKDFNKICTIVLFWCKAKSPSFVTVVTITAKPVLSGNPSGMAYWPLNTGWLFNPGLTNVRVIMENEGSQRIKYLPVSLHKLTITFSTSSWNKRKKVKTTVLMPYTVMHCYGTSSQSDRLIHICHAVAVLSQEIEKALFLHSNGCHLTKVYRGEDNTT